MNYAIVGYGRMGRAIDEAAEARGHRRKVVVDRGERGRAIARTIDAARWRGVDVAFEFASAEGARERVTALLKRGIAVVCGTTGWDAAVPEVAQAARAGSTGAVIAPNFSLGMGLFAGLVAEAGKAFARAGGYDPYVLETHHRGKLDAPSGTALWLAGLVAKGGARRVEGMPRGRVPAGAVHVASVRAGHEPGRHEIGFDGPHDVVTLVHAARGRSGFAEGAVRAAEWIAGRRGVHGFDAVCRDLVRGGGGKR